MRTYSFYKEKNGEATFTLKEKSSFIAYGHTKDTGPRGRSKDPWDVVLDFEKVPAPDT